MTTRRPDVIVAGGGVIGCSIARELALRDRAVMLLERGVPGREATWAAGGMLSPLGEAAHEDPLFHLAIASLDLWPAYAAEVAAESGIDVEYRPAGKLHVVLDETGESRLSALRRRGIGFGVQLLSGREARAVEPVLASDVRAALLIGRDHRVNNRKLGEALWKSAERCGVDVHLGAAAAGLAVGSSGVSGLRLADGTTVSAPVIVIAAGAWSGGIEGMPRALPVEPVRGQMFAVDASAWKPGSRPFLEHTIDAPGCYLIPRDSGHVVVGATVERSGFGAGPTPRGIGSLLQAAMRIVPDIAELPMTETWAGYRPGTPDDLPIVGMDPAARGLCYATGHFRNGVLLAPITARVVADLVMGVDSTVDVAAFRPDRFELN